MFPFCPHSALNSISQSENPCIFPHHVLPLHERKKREIPELTFCHYVIYFTSLYNFIYPLTIYLTTYLPDESKKDVLFRYYYTVSIRGIEINKLYLPDRNLLI